MFNLFSIQIGLVKSAIIKLLQSIYHTRKIVSISLRKLLLGLYGQSILLLAYIKPMSGVLRPSLICKAKIKICWNIVADCKGMRMRSVSLLDIGLTHWGHASQNDVWPYWMRTSLTEWGWPHIMKPFSQNEANLTEWGRPHRMGPA